MRTFSKDYTIPNKLFKLASQCYLMDREGFTEKEIETLLEDEKIVVFLTLVELIDDTNLKKFERHLFDAAKINCYNLFDYEPRHYNYLLKKYKEFKILNLKIPERYKESLKDLKLKFLDLNFILAFEEIYTLYKSDIRFEIINYENIDPELPRLVTEFIFYNGNYEFLSIGYMKTGFGHIKLKVLDSQVKSNSFRVITEQLLPKLVIK